MFGNSTYLPVVVSLDYAPGADDDIVLWRAPFACEIRSAYATTSNAVGASTVNYFDLALYNGGTAGTALTAIAGTIGGTAGWSALTPAAFTVSAGALTAGQIVTLRYNEEGTGTFSHMVVQLDVQPGT